MTNKVKKGKKGMTNEEAIKYLLQLYPNGGHSWLDEQRIEAIGMAIKALQKEPASEDFKEFEVEYFEREKDNIVCVYDRHAGLVDGAKWQKERISKQVLDATVHPSDGEIWVDCIFDLAPFKEDEKVKLIIIKEN